MNLQSVNPLSVKGFTKCSWYSITILTIHAYVNQKLKYKKKFKHIFSKTKFPRYVLVWAITLYVMLNFVLRITYIKEIIKIRTILSCILCIIHVSTFKRSQSTSTY